MKRIMSLVSLLLILFCIGCNASKEQEDNVKKQEIFNAIVLENNKNNLLVKPVEGESELKSSEKISVTKDVVSKGGVPDVRIGDEIRIVYDGKIEETYPAKLGVVYAIYLADELE